MDEEQSENEEDEEPPSSSGSAEKHGRKIVTLRSGEEFRGWKFESNKQQVLEERM